MATSLISGAVPLGPRRVVVHQNTLHPKQQQFYASPAKRKIVRAGRRGGKTTLAAYIAVDAFINKRRVLYAVPTSDQITRFWSEVTMALREMIEDGIIKQTAGLISWPGKEWRIRAKTAWAADGLRGDYCDLLILDEWQLMNESAWEEVGAPMLIDNNGDAMFIYTPPSLRSTGTSKAEDQNHAKKMFRKFEQDPTGRSLAMHFTSMDNPYLSKQGLVEVTMDMTALAYRQEILAEDIDEVPGALWTRKLIEDTRVEKAPPLKRIVVAVDPTGSSTNEAGIVAAGQGYNDQVYVIRDVSLLAPSSRMWAAKACILYDELKADRVIGERNYGGDMVRSVIESVDSTVAYKDVTAMRGKMLRAEPIAARFEKGMCHLVGNFPQLEEELVSYVPGNPSPNRMDAMVWACTALIEQGMIFGECWSDDLVYDDASMPKDLPNPGGHEARYIGVKYGAATAVCYLDIIDDGDTLWVHREHYFDPSVQMRQRTDQEYAADMEVFVGALQDTEIIIPPNCQSYGNELRNTGLWFREAGKEKDAAQVRDTIRLIGNLMMRKKLRIHKRCVNTIHQVAAYSWSEQRSTSGVEMPLEEGSEACIALRHVIKEKIPQWRLSTQ